MHPDPAFRNPDRALFETMIEQIGFGTIFLATPDGPRLAHTPLLSTGDGAVQFHLSNGNSLTRHLSGATALALVNGPDAYVSPRWYADADQVPTWNYVALELEGPVRRMDEDGLVALLEGLSARHEARLGGEPWTMDKLGEEHRRRLLRGITGFEMEARGWRETFKLSQNKPEDERARVIEGLEASGSPALAQLMRTLA